MITAYQTELMQSRITKAQAWQSNRTRDKAEVFTPSWICNEQNNLVDDQWFGRTDIFNRQLKKTWMTIYDKVSFPTASGGSWQDYVDSRRMEITCGEAPYLVSRYDCVTGEVIELKDRIGLLDRKLRVVNENTKNISDWLKWAERAYQSIYGFECQGDSLLIARVNLLMTFIENMECKFDVSPGPDTLSKIATIISWNVWQMDGLTYAGPFGGVQPWSNQVSMFDMMNGNKQLKQKYCKIKDWRSKKITEFAALIKGKR